MKSEYQTRRADLDAAVFRSRVELPAPAYFDTPQASAYVQVTRKQLEHWRSAGCGPAYSKLGRHVRYARADLDEWMRARRITSTAQEAVR